MSNTTLLFNKQLVLSIEFFLRLTSLIKVSSVKEKYADRQANIGLSHKNHCPTTWKTQQLQESHKNIQRQSYADKQANIGLSHKNHCPTTGKTQDLQASHKNIPRQNSQINGTIAPQKRGED